MFVEPDSGHGLALLLDDLESERTPPQPNTGQVEQRRAVPAEKCALDAANGKRPSLEGQTNFTGSRHAKENGIKTSLSAFISVQDTGANLLGIANSAWPLNRSPNSCDSPSEAAANLSPMSAAVLNTAPQMDRLQRMPKFTIAQYAVTPVPKMVATGETPRASDKPPSDSTDDEIIDVPKASDETVRYTPGMPTTVLAEVDPKEPALPPRALSLRRSRSWLLPSRSPSPNSRKPQSDQARNTRVERAASGPTSATGIDAPARSNPTRTKSQRSLSSLLNRRRSTKGNEPTSTSASASSSTDRLPFRDESDIPNVPSLASKERFQSAGLEINVRKKDELGSIFRSLDNDHQKFVSKPSSLKPNIVRNSLLPFLRNYAEHSSWSRLRTEDLDRRIAVLNKWWTSLLDMLSGKNGQSVSTSDRPAFLEAVSFIMSRPEWRAPATTSIAPTNRSRTTIQSQSSTSVDSATSDFLAESVASNVRNIFTQNLLAQMVYVVERMAPRNTPASVVTFCGKATAYAFYFCPGVADVLVRLWELSSDSFRRVLSEYGVSRNSNIRVAAQSIEKLFPSHLRALLFTSVPKLSRDLRLSSSLMDVNIDWEGPWKSRWLGKETDLFFCFTKHYHILLHEVLPENATTVQRLSAPGALLVQAQLLAVMDKSVRGAMSESSNSPEGSLPVTFDELLGPDASMEPVTSRVTANRSMAENRLIMLLRDFLSKSAAVPDSARRSFAIAFDALLKATARRVSVYDSGACFALCDFLEEAIPILSRYWKYEDPGAFLDWKFWFNVLQQMGESQNSTTDLRLYSFLYSIWGYVATAPERKRELCLEWLLNEDFAMKHLCHWCPMVRAYYMRLLCWRVLRYDGMGSSGDIVIFKTAHTRLRTVWEYFIYLQSEAGARRGTLLSTAPSNPVPQRRFLIVRNDSAPSGGTGFMAFDNVSTAASRNGGSASDELDESKDAGLNKKRWSSLGLRSLNPFGSAGASAATSAAGTQAATGTLPESKSSSPSPPSPSSPTFPASTAHSFKFALLPYPAGRRVIPGPRKLLPPNLPPPAQGFLQQHYPEPPKTMPQAPPPALRPASKYAGRALAEWNLLVDEVRWFLDRRRQQGAKVENGVWGEIPGLGIETVRGALG